MKTYLVLIPLHSWTSMATFLIGNLGPIIHLCLQTDLRVWFVLSEGENFAINVEGSKVAQPAMNVYY